MIFGPGKTLPLVHQSRKINWIRTSKQTRFTGRVYHLFDKSKDRFPFSKVKEEGIRSQYIASIRRSVRASLQSQAISPPPKLVLLLHHRGKNKGITFEKAMVVYHRMVTRKSAIMFYPQQMS